MDKAYCEMLKYYLTIEMLLLFDSTDYKSGKLFMSLTLQFK